MALVERKQELNQGQAKEKIDKTIKEEPPKDTGPYKGRPDFPTKEFDRWLESNEAFEVTGLSREERLKLGPRLSKVFGTRIEKSKGEDERIESELAKGKYGRFESFRDLNPSDREKVKKLYRGFFKK
jgi:hypothetical protein